MEQKNVLREDSIEFALQISDLCDKMDGCTEYRSQIIRSSSSIGANLHEARYAQSKADFINKLEVSLKECYETEYWLELFTKAKLADEDKVKKPLHDCGELRHMLVSSVNTLKNK